MIISNGTIWEKIQTGGGLDEEGNPISAIETLGEPIPCRIKANKQNNLGKQNGNIFKIASYEILIESRPFTAERVQLEPIGKEKSDFSVMFTEWMEAVETLKIVV